MKFKRMNRVSVSEEIIAHIKRLILSKELKPGDQLPSEEKMAVQMGVGRGTVREALKVLIHLGLIDRKNKRTCVSELALERLTIKEISKKFKDYRDVMEMIEVRKIIEPEAAALATERANSDEIQRLEKQYQLMLDEQHDKEKFVDHDINFHLYILQSTGNSIIKEFMQSIQQLLKKNQSLVLNKSDTIGPRSLDFHRKILAAIMDGDRPRAKRHMLNHILDVEKEMYLILKKEEGN